MDAKRTETTGKAKTWARTRTPGLLRHKTGRYYARFTLGGKTTFLPLKTTLLEIARTRFAEEKAKVERTRKAARNAEQGAATMGDLSVLYRARVKSRVGITEKTREINLGAVLYVERTWPQFPNLRPDQITASAVETWRDRALKEGTGFRPPNSKSGESRGKSGSSFNKAFDAVRRMLDVAVEQGTIHNNPLVGKRGLKAPDRPHKPKLPEASTLEAIFAEIERIGGRGVEAAIFCRFLAYTGCRQREAGAIRWRDVDDDRGIIRVAGTKTEAATREVPIIPAARELLNRITERRKQSATIAIDSEPYIDPSSPVLAVKEAQKSLTRACEAVGSPRLTHHDLRDAFATACIEAGVDIPTVAAWLGHADGGALLMKTYAHHRRAHSVTQAAKVTFGE